MIKFGTDGWRGIISDNFTYANLKIATSGLADLINKNSDLPKKIAVGYDRRFLSNEFAFEVCKVMNANGIEVLLAENFLPTPVLSWAAKNIDGLAGSIVITASHNPFYYNGFKFKERLGCSALPETTKKLEKIITEYLSSKRQVKTSPSLAECIKKGSVKYFNPIKAYKESLDRFVDHENIRNLKGEILIDPMHGSGSGYLADIIKSYGVAVTETRFSRDPFFAGVNPEPIEDNLLETIDICRKTKPLLAIVLDGDSDRIGAIDENGNFFNTQQVYSLVTWYFLKCLGKKNPVGKTVSTTHMVNRLAEKYGVDVVETPIGFKHLAKKMVDGEILLGGEESGGIGVAEHLPERDPILISILLLNILGSEDKGLAAIYEEISKEVGFSSFQRRDYLITDKIRDKINKDLKKTPPSSIGGKKVKEVSSKDGYKFYFSDNSWVLIRTSGTEAVLRIYAETESKDKSLDLIENAKNSMKIKNI